MTRSLTREEVAERWPMLLASSPHRTPFAQPAYINTLVESLGYTAEPFGVFDGTMLLGGIHGFTRRVGPYRMATVPPLTAFTPVLLSDKAGPETADALLDHLKQRYGMVHLHLHPALHEQVQATGWAVRTLYTYFIDLDGSGITDRWSAGARRLFRKHEAIYEVEESAGWIPFLVEHCRNSYARHGRKLPVPAARLTPLVGSLHAAGCVRVFAALERGALKPDAVVGLLHDGQTACYWLAGSIPGPAMTVLLGNVLAQLDAEGYTLFDFVGANTPSIAEFKRRFGGQRIPYTRLTHTQSPLARWWAAALRFR